MESSGAGTGFRQRPQRHRDAFIHHARPCIMDTQKMALGSFGSHARKHGEDSGDTCLALFWARHPA